jgi:hypothetical protein
MTGMKREPGRSSAATFDPEFSGVGLGKPEPSARSRRTLRCLIYVQCVTAALTALHQIHYGFRFLWTGEVRWYGEGAWYDAAPFEGISILAFFTVFLLPPLVPAVAVRGRVSKWELLKVVLASLALVWFQFLAILPEVQ